MKRMIGCILVMFFLFISNSYASTNVKVDSTEDGTTIKCDNVDLLSISMTLTKAFGVRVCSEDYGVVNPEIVDPADFESGGPISEGEEYHFSGEFSSATIEEMLDILTEFSPYTWQMNNACYIIHPRKGSLLMEETVTVDIPPFFSLWDAVKSIINARSDEAVAGQSVGLVDFRMGMPKYGPKDFKVSALTFIETPIVEALCRTVEAIPDDPGFLAIWTLCAGLANESRYIRIYLIETKDGALRKPLPIY